MGPIPSVKSLRVCTFGVCICVLVSSCYTCFGMLIRIFIRVESAYLSLCAVDSLVDRRGD